MSDPPLIGDLVALPRRRLLDLRIETGLVLLVCVAPLTFSSMVAMFGPQGSGSFLLDAMYTVIRSAGAIALVVFLIAKSGEAAALFGVRPFKPLADIGWGIGTFILGMVGFYLLWIWLSIVSGPATLSAMRQYDLSGLSAPSGPGGYALLVVMSLANGFAEEVVMRAYLIPRFEQLFGAAPLAVLLTSALFASYHTYQGPAGAISAAEIGLVYGAVFCVSRRLWPIAIAHAIQDIIGLAMLPK
jgi:membrane protease YdiL (CAAX protease family)